MTHGMTYHAVLELAEFDNVAIKNIRRRNTSTRTVPLLLTFGNP